MVAKLKLFLVILFGSALGVWIYLRYIPLITEEHGYRYTVQRGASMHSVIEELSQQQVITHPSLFKLLVYLKKNSSELKSGIYLFPKGASSSQILEQITLGTGVLYYTFTIIPGWNFNDLRKALLETPHVTHETAQLTDADIMKQLGKSDVKPEGEFYPDTYYFSEESSDISLLKRAYHAMEEKLKIAWEHRDVNLPYKTAYEALIVASLIEKEAETTPDRPLISGVIVNRLKKDMLLQIDPTVIYGMGTRYTGTIRKTDLSEDTPYNTYIRKGLPPTPIAMPGPASLEAAMHPAKHDYYYFVVKKPGESKHQFSKTLEEHYKAVAESRKISPVFFNAKLIRNYLLRFIS